MRFGADLHGGLPSGSVLVVRTEAPGLLPSTGFQSSRQPEQRPADTYGESLCPDGPIQTAAFRSALPNQQKKIREIGL